MPSGTLLANSGRKSERGLCRFEYETTTMASCLVDIPHSLRTDPNNGVQGFWLWASGNSKRVLKWGSGGRGVIKESFQKYLEIGGG